jgi:hypothetical protein
MKEIWDKYVAQKRRNYIQRFDGKICWKQPHGIPRIRGR